MPICGKVFERLIFNSVFEYLEEYKLLLADQSGFRANDCCVNHLFSIVHNIHSASDAYHTVESRGFYLDISKAFDKLWHEELIFKLKSVRISETLLELIKSFLANKFQRVVLNGQTTEWLSVKASAPQGSILGPLLFLIYINDLSVDIKSTEKLFADDTALFSIVHDPNTLANEFNKDLQKISE